MSHLKSSVAAIALVAFVLGSPLAAIAQNAAPLPPAINVSEGVAKPAKNMKKLPRAKVATKPSVAPITSVDLTASGAATPMSAGAARSASTLAPKVATKKKPRKGAKVIPMSKPDLNVAGSRLVGEQAFMALVGNSVSGLYDGQAMVDGYLPDHTVKSRVGDVNQVGRWGIVENKVCFQYPPENEATCYGIELDGNAVTMTSPEGEAFNFTMAKGIPADL